MFQDMYLCRGWNNCILFILDKVCRTLIVDKTKEIPRKTMMLQFEKTDEILTTLDLAPFTKKLMHWQATGTVDELFTLPGRTIGSLQIFNVSEINVMLFEDG